MKIRTCCILLVLLGVLTEQLDAGESAESATIRIASLSVFPTKWDKDANSEKIERMVRQAVEQGAQFVITPEGALEGYVVNEVIREKDSQKKAELTERFRRLAEPMDGEYLCRFSKLADELNIHLILGFLEAEKQQTYNSAVLFGPDGKVVGKYRKTHFAQGYEVNPPGYTPGDSYPVFDVGVMKVGMMICFDRQLPEPARELALGGADLIACPSYGGWGDWNTRLLQVRAYENQVYLVFTHPEQSLVIDRNGKLVDQCKKDAIVVREIKLSNLKKPRGTVTNRRPETYTRIPAKTQ